MSKSILSVNGSRAMNYLLQTIFESEFRFVPADNVFNATHYLRTDRQIDVLMVDVDFQPQQVWDFVQHIKSSRLYRVPVVVLATCNDDILKHRCYEYEVDEIFFKPFNPEDLVAAVKSLTAVPAIPETINI